ncbi:uncharacterized protein JCM15063_000302 [Sporobolomyces koalae]|uniref:uncharacterized protein n=1 Tax=Sporobolomyces koalae TaxID=500713 RepID=UPI00318058E5
MTVAGFCEPRPAPPPQASTPSLPQASPDFLSTSLGELSFFRSIVSHRLVGPEKHFHLLGVVQDIRNHAGKRVLIDEVWDKYRQAYDEQVLETTWAEQELAAVEAEEQEHNESETATPSSDEADPDVFVPNPIAADKTYARTFPRVEFSLDVEEFLQQAAFERGKRSDQDAPGSPPDKPLKEIFLALQDEDDHPNNRIEQTSLEDKKPVRSPRKRIATPKAAANAAAATASPRRKKGKQVTEEASGSELSDLTDDEEDEDRQEEGSDGETAGDEGDSDGDDGTAASQIDEEEDEEEEEPEQTTGRKRKAAAGRRPPSSKRTRNARSDSVATADSRNAAERKKEQATPSSRARGRGAGGSGRKPTRNSKVS